MPADAPGRRRPRPRTPPASPPADPLDTLLAAAAERARAAGATAVADWLAALLAGERAAGPFTDHAAGPGGGTPTAAAPGRPARAGGGGRRPAPTGGDRP